MFEKIEKWAIQRLLKKKISKFEIPKEWLLTIWLKYKDKIHEEVVKAIEKAIDKVINKALSEEKIEIGKK